MQHTQKSAVKKNTVRLLVVVALAGLGVVAMFSDLLDIDEAIAARFEKKVTTIEPPPSAKPTPNPPTPAQVPGYAQL
jgi:hypothetical protein